MRTTFSFVALLGLASCLSLYAQPADPVLDQARALLNTNQAEKASDLLEKAIAAKPNDPVRHYLLGEAYGMQAGQVNMFKAASLAGKARDEFAKAVQVDPNCIEARMDLMEFYLRAPSIMGGDEEKAREQANEIRKRNAFEGHRAFAAIASAKKDMNAARAEYIAMVKENPASPKSHYWLGIFFMTADKNYPRSLEEFDAALKIDPAYMPAVFQVGHVAALSGSNLARGAESLQKYLAYKPASDEPGHHRTHFWLGMIYEKQGKKADAKAHYETALKLRPNQKDVSEALKRVM
jgi:tetratricopeptide (TPR) repeat protein